MLPYYAVSNGCCCWCSGSAPQRAGKNAIGAAASRAGAAAHASGFAVPGWMPLTARAGVNAPASSSRRAGAHGVIQAPTSVRAGGGVITARRRWIRSPINCVRVIDLTTLSAQLQLLKLWFSHSSHLHAVMYDFDTAFLHRISSRDV